MDTACEASANGMRCASILKSESPITLNWSEMASALLTLMVAFLVAFSRPYDWVARIGSLSIALLGGLANLYGTSAIVRRLPIFVAAPIWWPQMGEFLFPALFFTFCSIFPRQLFRSRWIWLANVPALYFLWPF